MSKKKKKVFIEGPIGADFVATSIAKHQPKTGIGAHDIFLGQVRADVIDGKEVVGIEYSAYEEMAEEKIHEIREDTFDRFELSCMHIYHSLGWVAKGELSLFVFVSSAHRKPCFEALEYLVERIKAEVPIFGKEVLEGDTHQWKKNS
jgi:molybdopterin synthase catalytic subunit